MTVISLPTEVWRRIIQEATSPPGGLVTSWDYTPSERIFRGWEDIAFEDPEIKTKMSIVLVCRAWRSLGIQFLYEWVQFKTPSQATALAEVFKTSSIDGSVMTKVFESAMTAKEGEQKPTKTYGWWVKRIDGAAELFEEHGMDILYAFLDQCSQLEILIHSPPYARAILDHHDRGLTERQANLFPHTLRHLRLRLTSKSQLPPPLALTALTSITLVFGSLDQVVPDWELPSLRFLKLFLVYEHAIPAVIPFFERQGPNLIGLQLRSWQRVDSIASILSYTTALQSLVLDESDLAALQDTELSFPTITHVGIHLLNPSATEDSYGIPSITHAFGKLFWSRALPGLKSVRLLAVKEEATLAEKWDELLELCKFNKVVLGKE